MNSPNNPYAPPSQQKADCPAVAGSPSSDVVKIAVDLMKAGLGMSRAREKMEVKSWELIEALTADPGNFPKAVKIGEVDTDVATIRIDGVTSAPLEILTGGDGTFSVYADNFNEYGMPGRIIIDLGHGVLPENAVLSGGDRERQIES